MSSDLRLLIDLFGLGMVGLALLSLVAAWLWLTVLAFKTHPAWGALCYFLPFETVAYAIDHWREARGPVLLALAGVLCMGTVFLTGALLDRWYGPGASPSPSVAAAPARH